MISLLACLALGAPDLSFLVILTDDQRADSLWSQPAVSARLVDQGVLFSRAYATTPLCCPARASLYAGGFSAGNTNVRANLAPNGCVDRLDAVNTLATRLQGQGWVTGLVGKYLNDYPEAQAPAIPPGWTHFEALGALSSWSQFEVIRGHSDPDRWGEGSAETHEGYITWDQRDRAIAFLREHGQGRFFLVVAFQAPHPPQVPAPEDQGRYEALVLRPPSFNEADVSDKPAWVQGTPLLDAEAIAHQDEVARDQLRCLASVDRAVAAILDELAAQGAAGRTAVIYSSDNGVLWGEHRQVEKGRPYEEALLVPLVIRLPGATPGQVDGLVAADLDLPATLLELAGLDDPGDGLSLLPALEGEGTTRDAVIAGNVNRAAFPPWAALIEDRYKLVDYASGELELYDLAADPHELRSLHRDPDQAARVADMRARLRAGEGLMLAQQALPVGEQGAPYEVALAARGGAPPYAWSLEAGALPEGLSLDEAGRLWGTPREAGSYSLVLRVVDAGVSPHHGGPADLSARLDLEIAPRGCGCGGGGSAWLLLPPLLWRRRISR
ncbi:MAG: sulfatase [Deltaproteobacteria bacterium]|nr:sulfatase [Deltaproteobacteria bacterium]